MKKRFCFDRWFNIFIILGSIFVFTAIVGLSNTEIDDNGVCIGMLIVGAIMIIAPTILHPCGYIFDNDGITIYYLLMQNERYLWKNIYNIEILHHPKQRTVFHIYGESEANERFYMNGDITKTFLTKYYLNKYWDGEISGYLIDEIKDWWYKRKAKQAKNQYSTEEIAAKEREARKAFRENLEPFTERAELLGLEIKLKYLYENDDLKLFNSRPKEKYDYIANIELIRRLDLKSTELSLYLLKASISKNGYKGAIQKNDIDEFTEYLNDVFADIEKNGFDAFCEDNE